MILRQSAGSSSSTVSDPPVNPALFTRMSRREVSSWSCATASAIWLASVTSTRTDRCRADPIGD